jgi:1,4-alpha-glucan branching enzyme
VASVLSYLRTDDARHFTTELLSFTPIPHEEYRIGLPQGGFWREIVNTDFKYFLGTNMGNGGGVRAGADPWKVRPYSVEVILPPWAAVILGWSG